MVAPSKPDKLLGTTASANRSAYGANLVPADPNLAAPASKPTSGIICAVCKNDSKNLGSPANSPFKGTVFSPPVGILDESSSNLIVDFLGLSSSKTIAMITPP